MTPTQANIIDRLRVAAKEHDEVADLLLSLSEMMEEGIINLDATRRKSALNYFEAVLAAASFVQLDINTKDETEGEG